MLTVNEDVTSINERSDLRSDAVFDTSTNVTFETAISVTENTTQTSEEVRSPTAALIERSAEVNVHGSAPNWAAERYVLAFQCDTEVTGDEITGFQISAPSGAVREVGVRSKRASARSQESRSAQADLASVVEGLRHRSDHCLGRSGDASKSCASDKGHCSRTRGCRLDDGLIHFWLVF